MDSLRQDNAAHSSIQAVRRHYIADSSAIALQPCDGRQDFEWPDHSVETWDDGRLCVRDQLGNAGLIMFERELRRLGDAGVPATGLVAWEPPQVASGKDLQARAMKALSHWHRQEAYTELYDDLLPEEVLGLFDEHEALDIARCLARSAPVVRGFIARYMRARPDSALAARFEERNPANDPQQMAATLLPYLKMLWPMWPLWDGTRKRTYRCEEFRYDPNSGAFWDIIDRRQIKDIDAIVPQSLWPEKEITKPDGSTATIIFAPRKWLRDRDNGLQIDSVTVAPGEPLLIADKMYTSTGVVEELGRISLNLYRPGPAVQRDAPSAEPWLVLGRKLIPDRNELSRVLDYLAFTVQNPGKQMQRVVILGGEQGIGKDAFLQPLAYCVGWHNFCVITPEELIDTFNSYVGARLVMINEVKLSHAEGGAHALYSMLKSRSTSPPYMVGLNEKHEKRIFILKFTCYVATTNELWALYVPADDRRYEMPTIRLRAGWHVTEGKKDFFKSYFGWLLRRRGYAAVHRFLAERDISGFDPSEPAPLTHAKRMVIATAAPADNVLSRAIELLGDPDGFFHAELHLMGEHGDGGSVGGDLDRNFGGQRNQPLMAQLHKGNDTMMKLQALGYEVFPGPARWESGSTTAMRRRSTKAYVRRTLVTTITGEQIKEYLQSRIDAWANGETRPNKLPAQVRADTTPAGAQGESQ